ncbi:MAG: XkdF-like putative serine protease domain-containing protein [Peptococcaceae bacterium]|nr:XkdF-like putative serine protease domain-containing protein [Peptococcaceae bacterium]
MIDSIVEIEKFNPYHGADGRFTSPNAAASFTWKPGASAAHDKAIAREKEQNQPKPMSEDEYLGLHGMNSAVSDYMDDKLKIPHGLTQRQRKQFERDALAANREYHDAREAKIKEYREKVNNGELRPKTKVERLLETANGNEDNESVRAARRALDKRGIDWQTGKAVEKSLPTVEIFKTDDDRRLVFGWASVALTEDGEPIEDLQKDVIDPDDLEEAAYEYVLHFRDTGEEHQPGLRKKGKLVESCVFTAEKQRAMGLEPDSLPVGWWIGFKIDDEDTWQRVKDGTYQMFSIEGRAEREPLEKSAIDEIEEV